MESQLPAVTDAHLAPVSMSVERNPAALYLRRLPFSSGRRTMRQALEALHEWAEVRSTDPGPFLYPPRSGKCWSSAKWPIRRFTVRSGNAPGKPK
jgi:hypothetical protein